MFFGPYTEKLLDQESNQPGMYTAKAEETKTIMNMNMWYLLFAFIYNYGLRQK